MKKANIPSIYIITVISFVLCIGTTVFGVTLRVPDGYPTIQAGIDVAVNGDTVLVAPGTYIENIEFKGKTITVRSESGPGETIINGNRSGSVVTFWNSEANNAILNGFAITNGVPLQSMELIYPFGGGISIRNASPTIIGCTISGNGADYGGGIHIEGNQASPIIENNVISKNIASSVGAGIVVRDGASPRIIGNTIAENFTMQGSGIFISNNSSPIIEGNTLQYNDGGCCCMSRQDILDFLDGVNILERLGCGNSFPSTILVADQSSPVIRKNTITQNTSGGIGVFLGSSPVIDGNVMKANYGPHHIAAGLFVALNASPIVTENTIQDNQGSALWVDDSSSILDGNNKPISLDGFDVIEDADSAVTYAGDWEVAFGSNYSGGTARLSAGTNPSASLRFTGRGVSLIYFASENAGKAGIRIDGIDYPPVDMYSPATMQGGGKTEQVIATDLPPSEHVLTITMSGEKNPLSSGIGIVLDAVGVLSGTSVGDNTIIGTVNWFSPPSPQSEIVDSRINLVVPDQYMTIQSAIDSAGEGDTVIVAPGNYRENIDFRGKNISVQSSDPENEGIVSSTIIDAQKAWPTITFASGEKRRATLKGFVLKNSFGARIIQISASNPTISKNVIQKTTGEGIYCDFADSPLITSNTIKNNDTGDAGIINCYFSSPIISENIVHSNMSSFITTYFSSPLILNNTIFNNSVPPLYLDHFSTATISGNTITGTKLGPRYGGDGIILDFFSDCRIEKNIITDNYGDGIFMIIDSSPTITNNIIARNGGGLNLGASRPRLINNTIADNLSPGIYIRDVSKVFITNCIFRNEFDIGVEPYAEVSITYSAVRGDYEGEGNISQDPLFANDNYLLSDSSPCIDSGTSLDAPDTDIRGTPRPQGGGYDMGAYEFNNFHIESFVTRFYQLCLNREADQAGMDGWVLALLNGTQTGSDVAYGFVFSQEFINKNTTDLEYLTILYKAFFNRKPDSGGLHGWLDAMQNGASREDVLNGFIYATEFAELCEEYGIKAYEGHITKAQREAVKAFVTRFYQLCLSRDPDPAGLEGWANNLLNQIQTGADVANGFIYSQEFINKNTSNDEYLTILYKAFFNRDPDQGGWDLWLAELNSGRDRGYVLNGFLGSQEFIKLCEDYGITPF